jgi:hypothetical protein
MTTLIRLAGPNEACSDERSAKFRADGSVVVEVKV